MTKPAKVRKFIKDKGLQERIIFLTDESQRAWLQAQSEQSGAPVSAIVRRAVDAYRAGLERKPAK
jgi:arsenate reductase-like glutaredoxin family protein